MVFKSRVKVRHTCVYKSQLLFTILLNKEVKVHTCEYLTKPIISEYENLPHLLVSLLQTGGYNISKWLPFTFKSSVSITFSFLVNRAGLIYRSTT